MRILFPLVSLVIVAFSILLDSGHVSADSSLCRLGFCRFDQIFSSIDAEGMNLSSLSVLLNEDPLNPMAWCAYAEQLSMSNQVEQASAAFDHALVLGPEMSPVLMRVANFDFAHGRIDHAFLMTKRILQQTDAFDEILFSYLTHSRILVRKLLGVAIPVTPRATRSWLSWLHIHGSDQDLCDTWSWMRQNQLADQKLASDLAWTLWQRKSFHMAQDLWTEWLRMTGKNYLRLQQLANVRFEEEPNGSPFDWKIESPPSVRILRKDGLDIRFAGTENVDLHVHQFATVNPGCYRFSAEMSAQGLTTDQRPFFHILDVADPARFSAQTPLLNGLVTRSWISLDFEVSPATKAIKIELERQPSRHFDNKINGALHIYQASLVRLAITAGRSAANRTTSSSAACVTGQ